MSSTSLPTAREVRVRLALLDAGVAGVALLLMAAYLASLLDLLLEEWSTLATSTLVFALLAAVGSELMRRLQQRPLARFLDAEERGTVAASDIREAFRSAIALPTLAQRNAVVVWLLGTGFVALWMHLSGEAGWGADFRMLVLIAAGVSAAAISAQASFFLVKREVEMLRETLASRIPEPEQRRALIRGVSVVKKLRLAVAANIVLSLMLAILLGHSQTRQAVDSAIAGWQQRAVSMLAAELGDARDRPALERIVAARLPRTELMAAPAEFRVRLEGELATEGRAVARRIHDDLAAGLREGTTVGTEAPKLVVWRALGEGRLLLSSVSRQGLPRLPFASLAALVAAIGVGLCIAQLLASDIRRAATKISDAVERMANGDLRSTHVLESEDELGTLGRSFERMGSELHATVGRVADAADRVDSAASQISAVSKNVVGASDEQSGRIEQAMDLMARINDQVAEVSHSARALNLSVEESSSSILELGAAGEELNETASVLSVKVDEVSTSIEEMVRSVKHVRTIGDALADAAAETSSSMEEMASAMRAVDNTAEMTASLSREMVGSAESGQAKVSQTIEGMQAIREATDAAEAVIRGLGDRTKEIGAILDVIDDVADETNLLALNAAIISAQAGEHGRAFSVVADEIKDLADRVLASTKEIGSLIQAVQGESSNAVGAIEDGSRSVASGVQLSVEAGVSLEGITRSARESGSHIGEIAAAVQLQTKAAGQVVELMDRVRNGVEQIAAAGGQQDRGNETIYRSAVTMSEVAQQVRRTTEEQSRGFGRIRESVEGVRDAIEQINGSLQQQSSACSQVVEFLEQVVERSRGNARAAQGMGEAVQLLTRQAESLREDVARFQT